MQNNLLNHGHRSKVKEKFLINSSNFDSQDLLELLLFYSIPRKDVKLLAKQLLAHFGSIEDVINASHEELKGFHMVSDNTIILFKLYSEIHKVNLYQTIKNKTILESWPSILSYCHKFLKHSSKELLHILYLDSKHYLINTSLQQTGTLNTVHIYTKEIVKSTLNIGASAIILVHNHPHHNSSPSHADIQTTKALKNVLSGVDVSLHDHIIVSDQEVISFKQLGIIL